MGVSTAAHALESLFFQSQPNPASSSAGAFSTGQGLPTGGAAGQASPQTAPSHHSHLFAQAALGVLTALQDPESAVAGFVHGAETAIGKDIQGVAHVLEKLKDALTGAGPSSASVSATALAAGSAAATTLASAFTSLLHARSGASQV